jgi:hypothetical protein
MLLASEVISCSIRFQNTDDGLRLRDPHWYTALLAAPICAANSRCKRPTVRRRLAYVPHRLTTMASTARVVKRSPAFMASDYHCFGAPLT